MAIERTESRQETCNAIVVIEGERKQAASATCSIRPGRSMTFSIDVNENIELNDEDRASVARLFDDFLAGQRGVADAMGIPILPGR